MNEGTLCLIVQGRPVGIDALDAESFFREYPGRLSLQTLLALGSVLCLCTNVSSVALCHPVSVFYQIAFCTWPYSALIAHQT